MVEFTCWVCGHLFGWSPVTMANSDVYFIYTPWNLSETHYWCFHRYLTIKPLLFFSGPIRSKVWREITLWSVLHDCMNRSVLNYHVWLFLLFIENLWTLWCTLTLLLLLSLMFIFFKLQLENEALKRELEEKSSRLAEMRWVFETRCIFVREKYFRWLLVLENSLLDILLK